MKNYIVVFSSTFLLYAFSAGRLLFTQSTTPHYVLLAYSLIRGHLNLIEVLPQNYDLIWFQGKWYVPGAPAPALLLMPLVLIFGINTSDVFFGVLIGAINVTLAYHLFGKINVEEKSRTLLTILFAAGTVHWWISSQGAVWFNAHSVAVFFLLLYILQTLSHTRPWLSAIWLGLATLSRPTTFFTIVFYLAYTYRKENFVREKWLPFALFLVPVIALMMAYNDYRFGNPLDFGYAYVAGAPYLMDALHQNGGFNPIFMPCNMYISLFGMPMVVENIIPIAQFACPHMSQVIYAFTDMGINPLGLSIFLTTPAFLFCFRAKWHEKVNLSSLAAIVATIVPLWMYHNTGSIQFGYRYQLDFIPFLFLLLASGIRKPGRIEWLSTIVSVVINFAGMTWMYAINYPPGWFRMWSG